MPVVHTSRLQAELDRLRGNPKQWAAIQSDSNTVVLAGPGSGKTRTLVAKVGTLLRSKVQQPHSVACITYNNHCVAELRERLSRIGFLDDDRLFLGTVHSFCLTQIILPYHRFSDLCLPSPIRVASKEVADELLEEAAESAGLQAPAYEYATQISNLRLRSAAEGFSVDGENPIYVDVSNRYQKLLRSKGVIDYDDIVVSGSRIVRSLDWVRPFLRAKYPFLVVDEYQDLGIPLDELVRSLVFLGGSSLFAVGDPDQSIYGFAGAAPERLRNLSIDKRVKTIRLDRNYRSSQGIIDLATEALSLPTAYRADRDSAAYIRVRKVRTGLHGQAIAVVQKVLPELMRELPGLRQGQVAVLYPTWREGNAISRACESANIPYVRNDNGRAYPRTRFTRWLEDAARWSTQEHLGQNIRWRTVRRGLTFALGGATRGMKPHEAHQMAASYLWPNRGEDGELRSWLHGLCTAILPLLRRLREYSPGEVQATKSLLAATKKGGPLEGSLVSRLAYQGGHPDSINLLTLHGSKGLEFQAVVMLALDNGILPAWFIRTKVELDEQRRLFYVGLTRAQTHIYLLYSGFTQNQWGRKFHKGATPFLEELFPNLNDHETW